jgi:hypothetical protein
MNLNIIKLGGSLINYPKALKSLCNTIGELSKDYNLLIIPGGGIFADAVRQAADLFNLGSIISHKMAIQSMDIYGTMLSDLIPNSTLVEIPQLDAKTVKILKVAQLLKDDTLLDNSWDTTSDSIACYIANRLGVPQIIKLTDIDGLYLKGQFIGELTLKAYLEVDTGPLDKNFWKYISKGVKIVILNGLVPSRLREFFLGIPVKMTVIHC